ncbi:MAG: response regulator [Segetibacter sp.]|jgi:CheY-like chemotaxis protein|nr:response regulator [Segetibacter sp.]
MSSSIKHIVVADDDRDDLDFFTDALRDNCPDITVTVAEDGSELLYMLNKISLPDIIVLDLNMPRISGKDCLKVLRKDDKYEKVPIVIYSTSSNSKDIEECLNCGANHYVTKPSSMHAISTLVKKLCNGEMALNSTEFVYN